MSESKGQVIVYQSEDGATQVDVSLYEETVWLNLNQMVDLFQRDKSVISRHLRNIFKSGELARQSVVAKYATTAADGKTYQVEYFNLDAIISLGYRVNSLRGTQFRIWATRVLQDHILRGYTINERRLKELRQTIRLVQNVIEHQTVTGDEASALLRVVSDYTYALDLLDDYDHQRVEISDTTRIAAVLVTYKETVRIIGKLRETYNASDLFGKEKDRSLESSLKAIVQTYDGKDVYPTFEEKAAHLLYFLVKNHSFIDGNKRIAAALFLWFLDKNRALYREDGMKRLPDNALVAITLMIAESRPEDKDIITKVIVNLINQRTLGE